MEEQASLISEDEIPQAKIRNGLAIAVALHLAALQLFSGINAFILYGGDIAAKSVSSELALLMNTFLNGIQIFGALLASFLLISFGRKPILQIGSLIATISHLLIALGFYLKFFQDNDEASQVLVIVGLFMFMAAYSFSLGPVIWMYIP